MDLTGFEALAVLAFALALDAAYGEPPAAIHPVVWMGRVANALLALAPRRAGEPARGTAGAAGSAALQLAFGALVAIAVPTLFAVAAFLLLQACAATGIRALELAVAVILLKSTFAVRALGEAAAGVRDALATADLEEARSALASLCSRDASHLREPDLVAATVESVAENASDSAIAPLLFFLLFGVPGAIAYRAINTLDAMIGYHGATEYLGKTAARLDDVANFLPARLTALLLLAGGALTGGDLRGGWRILRRDGAKTESPNAGRPMAAMAGLLGVELAKAGHYRLGDPTRILEVAQIDRAWRIVGAAIGAGLVLALGATLVVAAALGGAVALR